MCPEQVTLLTREAHCLVWGWAVMLHGMAFHFEVWACFSLPSSEISGPWTWFSNRVIAVHAVPRPAPVQFSCMAVWATAIHQLLPGARPSTAYHAFATFFIKVFTWHVCICAWCKKVWSLLLYLFHVFWPANIHSSVAVSNYYDVQVICKLIPYIVIFI